MAFFRSCGVRRLKDDSPKALARAEAEASARGWRFDWEGDPDGVDHVDCLGVVLRDGGGHALADQWGIPDRDMKRMRRVIQAKLALKALSGGRK